MCGTCREVIGVGRELFIGESRGGKASLFVDIMEKALPG